MNIPKDLKEKIELIPKKPGIYKMLDCHGNIIYIGKSKCLNKRVKSYFYSSHNLPKLKRLVFNIHDIDIIVTDTHLEAQLLECAMIKKYMPIYNTQFAKDKNYVYLKVEDSGNNPLSISNIKNGKYTYGPFRSKYYLYDLITLLTNLYSIKKVGNTFKFQYNSLPVSMEEDEFKENRKSLIELFDNINSLKIFLDVLKSKMDKASKSLNFEKASQYRDIYLSLKNLYEFQNNSISKNKDIITGEKIDQEYKLFYIYDGNLIMKKKFKHITVKNLWEFINTARFLKTKRIFNKDEKRKMDFSSIIDRELKNRYFKIVDKEFKADEFINDLLKS